MFQKLKERWGVRSNVQLFIIFVVFAITGSMSVKLGQPLLNYFDISPERFGKPLYYFFRVLLVFPLYQILLLFFGTLFFQFKFFWAFEKKMLRNMRILPKEKSK